MAHAAVRRNLRYRALERLLADQFLNPKPAENEAEKPADCGDCGLTTATKDAESLALHFAKYEHPFTACMEELADRYPDEERRKTICGAVKAHIEGTKKHQQEQVERYQAIFTPDDRDIVAQVVGIIRRRWEPSLQSLISAARKQAVGGGIDLSALEKQANQSWETVYADTGPIFDHMVKSVLARGVVQETADDRLKVLAEEWLAVYGKPLVSRVTLPKLAGALHNMPSEATGADRVRVVENVLGRVPDELGLMLQPMVRRLLSYALVSTLPAAKFDESKHPRHPKGSPEGGQFAEGGGGGQISADWRKQGVFPGEWAGYELEDDEGGRDPFVPNEQPLTAEEGKRLVEILDKAIRKPGFFKPPKIVKASDFDPAKHPRHPKGRPEGGQFSSGMAGEWQGFAPEPDEGGYTEVPHPFTPAEQQRMTAFLERAFLKAGFKPKSAVMKAAEGLRGLLVGGVPGSRFFRSAE
jgi:hypothetical protein